MQLLWRKKAAVTSWYETIGEHSKIGNEHKFSIKLKLIKNQGKTFLYSQVKKLDSANRPWLLNSFTAVNYINK